MKKTLFFAGMIAAPISMALAKTITDDTPVEWNSTVIEQALNKAGFVGGSGANWDVRVTHDRISAELLRRGSFSMNDAAKVCVAQCSKSDFLKNGRGASGKKCPALCKAFTEALYSVNNSSKSAGKSAAEKRNITLNTEIRWNKDVIKRALSGTGIISNTYSDVGTVHDNIVNALLKLDTFSARQAIDVCKNECDKSEMLREGKGKSGKKCPQLCDEFGSSLVIANNDLLTGNTERQKVGSYSVHVGSGYFSSPTDIYEDVITTFKGVEHGSKDFCRILTNDAFNRGIKYPMVCGGECAFVGQDIIEVSGGGKTLYYEVDDYCDGFLSSGESFWVVHADGTIKKIKNKEGRDTFGSEQLDAIDKTYRK